MPIGVKVATSTSPGPSTDDTAPIATGFIVAQTERGSTTVPTVCTSFNQYQALLGNRVAYGSGSDCAQCYFADGGTKLVVARVVGGSATVGTLTLQDRNGSPTATLRVDAASKGSWSSQLKVQVADDTVSNHYVITVTLNGVVVEKHANLASPADAVSAFSGSQWVVVTNLASSDSAPTNNPAVLAATSLSAGADDAGSVNTAALIAALPQFTADLGGGMVAIPGQAASAVGAALIAHAILFHREMCVAPALGTSTTTAKSDAAAFRATTGAEYGMYAYPWVAMPDGAGGSRLVSGEGSVMGLRARAQVNVGVWQEPIASFGISQFLVGIETPVDAATNDDLYDNNVSAFRVIAGGPRLYGYRSLSADTVNYKLLRDRSVLNYVAIEAARVLENEVGATIDGKGQFFDRCGQRVAAIVDPMAVAGGLYPGFDSTGNQVDPGYLIDTGPDVNPTSQLRQDIAGVAVAVRPSPEADLINVNVTKVAVGTPI